MRNIIIVGISSDIGYNLAKFYLNDDHMVIGTYRSRNSNVEDIESMDLRDKVSTYELDITNQKQVNQFPDRIIACGWNTIIFSVCDIKPVGKFFDVPFEEWANSVNTNLLSQLNLLHSLYKYSNPGASVVFFAGMGTNSAVDEQSAICLSKIGLIKMVELLNCEYEDINPFIIGPGFVRTKVHKATLNYGAKNSESYRKVKDWIDSGKQGTPMIDIYNNIEWCISQGKAVSGGRNFSTVHDCWGSEELANQLLKNNDMYKLRRSGNDWRERAHEG
jgi:NAD(P)-dependent dehydrogenase (short-subunit alcohol dehydrogenase family)